MHVAPTAGADAGDVAVAVTRDLRVAAGLLPTQVLVVGTEELPAGAGWLSRRVLSRGRPG